MNLMDIINYISMQLKAPVIHDGKNSHSIKGIANTFVGALLGSEINIFFKVPNTHLSFLFLCAFGKKDRGLVMMETEMLYLFI